MEENAWCFSVSLCKDWLLWRNDNDLSSTYSVYSKVRVHPSSTYFHISVISSHYCHPMSLNVIIMQYATLPLSVSHVSPMILNSMCLHLLPPNILIAAANKLANLDLPRFAKHCIFAQVKPYQSSLCLGWHLDLVYATFSRAVWLASRLSANIQWRPCLRRKDGNYQSHPKPRVFRVNSPAAKCFRTWRWTCLQPRKMKTGSNQPKPLTSSEGTPFAIQRGAKLLQ